jgi:DNA-binding NtrC family response regulator
MSDLVASLLHDLGRGDLKASDATLAALREHTWPGNVRELKNMLACAVALVDAQVKVLDPIHLRLVAAASDKDMASEIDALPLAGLSLDRIEQAAIRQTLRHASGNKASAARSLGIAISTLYEKLKKFGIEERTVSVPRSTQRPRPMPTEES